MDQFSFVMVLVSLIVGLGLAELLTNVARQIQLRRTVKFYWLHSVLVIIVFLALLQQWWELWSLSERDVWTFQVLIFMLGGPICLYLVAHVLFPEDMRERDLETAYFEDSRFAYILAAIVVVVATLFKPLSFGFSVLTIDNLSSLILLVFFLLLAIFNNKRLHSLIVPIILIAVLSDIMIFNPQIG